jgi:hypothetical protein
MQQVIGLVLRHTHGLRQRFGLEPQACAFHLARSGVGGDVCGEFPQARLKLSFEVCDNLVEGDSGGEGSPD